MRVRGRSAHIRQAKDCPSGRGGVGCGQGLRKVRTAAETIEATGVGQWSGPG